MNRDTGFVGGNRLLKTTNGGVNWSSLTLPSGSNVIGLHVLSEDTIWFTDDLPFDGGIFRTTNKGISWEKKIWRNTCTEPEPYLHVQWKNWLHDKNLKRIALENH